MALDSKRQAAELALASELNCDIEDLRCDLAGSVDDGTVIVHVDGGYERYAVDLTLDSSLSVIASCGELEQKVVPKWRVQAVRRIADATP